MSYFLYVTQRFLHVTLTQLAIGWLENPQESSVSSTFSGSMCAQGRSSLKLIMGLLNSEDEASVFQYNHMSSAGLKHSFDSHIEQVLRGHVRLLQCLAGERAGADRHERPWNLSPHPGC